MGRSLILAEFQDLIVATSHFESLDNAGSRNSQMTETFDLLRKSGVTNVVVAGDYNFDTTYAKEEAVLGQHGMKDIVNQFCGVDSFSMYKSPKFPAWRPDKIVIGSD